MTANVIPHLPPRWTVAPTEDILTIRFNPTTRQRSLDPIRWGLIPHWATDSRVGNKLINARAEGLANRPSFRDAFHRRRCLIPADAFYEWKTGPKPRQPYLIRPRNGAIFAFAGLWENWRSPDGFWIRTTTIITTNANAVMADVHDRMPTILAESYWAAWLGEVPTAPDILLKMLRPCPTDELDIILVESGLHDNRKPGADAGLPFD